MSFILQNISVHTRTQKQLKVLVSVEAGVAFVKTPAADLTTVYSPPT